MKKIVFLSFLSVILLQGCYTIIMTPEDRVSGYDDHYGFYGIDYFGAYDSYYNIPWWISSPIVTINSTQSKTRNNSEQSVRNENGNRQENERRDIISPRPPSRDSGSNSNETNNSSSSSNSNNEIRTNTNSSGSSNNGIIRNESGNRNSGNSRR